jgi:hypothetical protein
VRVSISVVVGKINKGFFRILSCMSLDPADMPGLDLEREAATHSRSDRKRRPCCLLGLGVRWGASWWLLFEVMQSQSDTAKWPHYTSDYARTARTDQRSYTRCLLLANRDDVDRCRPASSIDLSRAAGRGIGGASQ